MKNLEKYVTNENREVGEIWQGNEYVAFAFATAEYSAMENAQRIADCLNEVDSLREEVKRLRGEYSPKQDYSNAPEIEPVQKVIERNIAAIKSNKELGNCLYTDGYNFWGFEKKVSQKRADELGVNLIWERDED